MQMLCETNRLILKVLTDKSADDVLNFYFKNKDFFEPWDPIKSDNFYTKSYHKVSLNYEYNQIITSQALRYWIFNKENPDKIIGTVSVSNILRGAFSSCSIGYKLDKEYLGNGFAIEAVRMLIDIIYFDYRLHRIEAFIMPNNLPSIRLVENLGFHYEGKCIKNIQINGEWEDHLRYALINYENS